MKKANKLLMAAVAILLCLVLISTSILSGVFAKFVHQRAMDATMTFKHLGVTVTMSADTNKSILEAAGATISTEVKNGKSGTITISDLSMRPGVVVPRAVKFTFSGTPTVPVQVKITPTVKYKNFTTANLKVPANTIKGTNGSYLEEKYYMPMAFTFGQGGNTAVDALSKSTNLVVNPWTESTNANDVSDATISNSIASRIKSERFGTGTEPNASVDGNILTIGNFTSDITFHINSATSSNYFHMGFGWELEHGNSAEEKDVYNKIETYITQRLPDNASITVSYTVEVVQVS